MRNLTVREVTILITAMLNRQAFLLSLKDKVSREQVKEVQGLLKKLASMVTDSGVEE